MNRPWALLLLAIVAAAIALAAAGRRPHRAPAPTPPAPPAPLDTFTLAVGDSTVAPAEASFRLGHRLAVTFVPHGRRPVRIALAGYEHRLAGRTLVPGAACTETLTLDLPGEAFAWRLDGRPTGRIAVLGSHLVEGHR